MRILVSLFALSVLVGCSSDSSTDHPPVDPDDPTLILLTPTQHLTRASIALRGMRPSVEQLEAVANDPDKLPSIVDEYLSSPEFGLTIRELHNQVLLLRVEQPQLTFPNLAPIATATAREINDSVFDEPLRLIEDIVMSDQSYQKVVTADYTMANGIVAAISGYAHTSAPEAWEKTPWPDARGNAGVLATTTLYHRWRSAGFNYNRGRANMISRAFLCHDYLTSDIVVDTSIDLSDPDVVANAVVQNKSCAGCHHTLDPLASYLFPMRPQLNAGQVTSYPIQYYLPNQINRWQTTNKRPPMFFGEQASGLAGLGKAIADDPRFSRCAAQNFASYLTEVPDADLSGAWIARLQGEFVAAGYNAKQLAKAIVLSNEFRVSHSDDVARAETVVGTLKARPEQLARMLADLTGLDWRFDSNAKLRGIPYGSTNLLESDFIGFRVLGGGIDSYFVTQPVHTMNATSSLVARTAAGAAADFVVDRDATAPVADRKLFVKADVTSTDEAHVRAELAYLHARIYSELVEPGSPEVDDTYALFTDALAQTSDPKRAWKLTLVGMFGDFRSLFY
jgi:hypothetical protein